jgi:hypothetical protein
MGHDPRAWSQLASQPGFEIAIDARGQVQGDDRRLADAGREEVAFDESDLVVETGIPRDLTRARHQFRVELDPHAAGSVLLRGEHHDAAVPGSQVIHDVVAGDARELEHLVHDRFPSRREEDVGCADRTLRGRGRAATSHAQANREKLATRRSDDNRHFWPTLAVSFMMGPRLAG